MRIRNVTLGVGIEYAPPKKSAAAAVIGAIGGLASSALTNSANANLNAQNRQWQHDEAELARQWQSNEWQRQFGIINAYNTPAMQAARLKEAGINPSVAFEGTQTTAQTQYPSTPSAASAPTASSIPMGVYGMPALADIGNGFKSIAEALKTSQELPFVGDLMAADIRQKLAAAGLADAQKASTEYNTYLEQLFGEKLRDANIQKLVAESENQFASAQLAAKQGDYYDVKKLTEVNEALLKAAQAKLTSAEYQKLEIQLKYEEAKCRMSLRVGESEIQRNVAGAAESYASARHTNVLAEIAQVDRELAEMNYSEQLSVREERYQAVFEKLQRESIINQELYNQVQKLIKENKWYEVHQVIQVIQELADVGNTGSQITERNMRTGRQALGIDDIKKILPSLTQ